MTEIFVKQSEETNMITIPMAVLNTLGLQVGSKLDMTIKENKLV